VVGLITLLALVVPVAVALVELLLAVVRLEQVVWVVAVVVRIRPALALVVQVL
jgi:hypothetical protein